MSDTPGGPFKKGDPRINRKGRPRTFDALRELAQQIAHEEAKANGQPLVIDGHIATVTEVIMRQWAQSKDARLQQAFIAYAYGKPPEKQEVRNVNIDLSKMSDEQVEQLANGADIYTVLADSSTSGAGTEKA